MVKEKKSADARPVVRIVDGTSVHTEEVRQRLTHSGRLAEVRSFYNQPSVKKRVTAAYREALVVNQVRHEARQVGVDALAIEINAMVKNST